MKFSHSVQFNAVPDWSGHYINYSNLKKLIYTLEKFVNQGQAGTNADPEASPLLAEDADPDTAFQRALDAELEKICSFYHLKEREIFEEVELIKEDEDALQREAQATDLDEGNVNPSRSSTMNKRRASMLKSMGSKEQGKRSMGASTDNVDADDSDDEDDMEESTMLFKTTSNGRDGYKSRASEDMGAQSSTMSARNRKGSESQGDSAFLSLYTSGLTLKKRVTSLYVSLCELKSYIQLNKTGFSKALKKYDKTLDRTLKAKYIKEFVDTAYPFKKSTLEALNEHIAQIEAIYADLVTKKDIDLAKRELRLHLREHVVYERNTVWREMVGIERKAQAVNLGIKATLLGGDNIGRARELQGDEPATETKQLVTPAGRFTLPAWLFGAHLYTLIGITVVFIILLSVKIMDSPEQQNCLAMLIFVSLLWATEVIPLYVTALFIPFLAVVLQVARSDTPPNRRLEPKDACKYIFASMWTPVIMLLIGGFTLAAALSKWHIAKLMATFTLSKAGTNPKVVLITNMFVAMFLSMWISNVAAPALCFGIISPLLRNLPADSNMTKALILGIALACNVGGAASPIASPQNIIALENMRPAPSWLVWFFVALPVCILSIFLIWGLLLITFKPGKGVTIVPIRPSKDKFSGTQWFVSIVTLATIALWCVSHQVEHVFGDMGIIAILPIVIFFGSGVLTKEDFAAFPWTIIMLAAGGLSLGKSVSSSGLLATIAEGITSRVQDLSLYALTVTFAALILVIATFISHTVAALVFLPLVQQVGMGMATDPHPNLLVMSSALMCSAAMGLPTSGFPNMTAIMMEDFQGHRYLGVKHFISRGVPASILTFSIVVSVGYGLMYIAGL